MLRREVLEGIPFGWFVFMHKDCPRAPSVFAWPREWFPDLYDRLMMIEEPGERPD